MQHRAIETRYKGYRFRSRLEARWAVFFDTLGLEWEYEPEGFDLGDGVRYLPDFRIGNYWIEVKPKAGHDEQFAKAKRFAATGATVIGLGGLPGTIAYPVFGPDGEGDVAINADPKYGPFFWACGVQQWANWADGCSEWLMASDGGKLYRAIDAARSARFEFGENGVRA